MILNIFIYIINNKKYHDKIKKSIDKKIKIM